MDLTNSYRVACLGLCILVLILFYINAKLEKKNKELQHRIAATPRPPRDQR